MLSVNFNPFTEHHMILKFYTGGGGGRTESGRADFNLVLITLWIFKHLSPNFVTFPKIYCRLNFHHHCLIVVSAVSMATAYLKKNFSFLHLL